MSPELAESPSTGSALEPLPDATAWAAELEFAVATAAEAGAVLMDRYERLERVAHKSARDVVTEADHLSEELIIRAIRDRFPGDAILAEESGAHRGRAGRHDRGAAGESSEITTPNGRTWVIDPLDGTVNYANGLPMFCVSIGFVVDGRPTAGAVLDPTRNETFAAARDGAATLNGRPIQASTKDQLSDYVISLALSGRSVPTRGRAIRKLVRVSRSMGSASLGLAYVANGRFDAFVQETSLSAWDIAAAGLIAERAGAVVTAFDGAGWYDPSRTSRAASIVAAPLAFHSRLRALATGRG
ncbi:MAG TPA: inositol monophosphatase family protein [Candidatus Limnocylindrales bacterium]|nr:inositol monophosphatase family protein [Candidatus Limnocylindrales bacterium]